LSSATDTEHCLGVWLAGFLPRAQRYCYTNATNWPKVSREATVHSTVLKVSIFLETK